MRPLMRLVLGFLISLTLGMGAIAHAGEAAVEIAVEACVQSAAHPDGEPRDSDADRGLHAHGGCHGHHQADAVGHRRDAMALPVRALNFAAGEDFLPQLVPDANLRPPIA